MDISFQSVNVIEYQDSERAIFNVLKATLQFPASQQAKSAKLTEDFIFICRSQEESPSIDAILWEVWAVVIDIAQCIPPDHPWQNSLVQSLESLRERDDTVLENGRSGLWKNLPNLSFCIRENWNDPTYTGEDLSEEFAKWRNLNSFIIRLTSASFAPWLNFPIWQLRIALEEPLVTGTAMECRLWVAGEWIINCADLIFQDMSSEEALDEATARALKTGSLCDGIQPRSVERWEFWRKRFSELATDFDSLHSDDAIAKVSYALKSMDVVKSLR